VCGARTGQAKGLELGPREGGGGEGIYSTTTVAASRPQEKIERGRKNSRPGAGLEEKPERGAAEGGGEESAARGWRGTSSQR